MPYFKNDNVNVLFIHIPKTGGTSIEHYLSKKYNIALNEKSMYMFTKDTNIFNYNKDFNIEISLQHQTLKTILDTKEYFQINLDNLKIFAVVRNPYDRIISDLFFYNLINEESTCEETYEKILDFTKGLFDNHPLPQYKYIVDENDKIYDNVIVIKNENLNEEMKKIGFDDYEEILNSFKNIHDIDLVNKLIYHFGKINKNKYRQYLNEKSIEFINDFYKKDFEYFNYRKI